MSNQKKLDVATIIIILVSIILILSGFFLLNKSYTKNTNQKSSTSSISSTSVTNSSLDSKLFQKSSSQLSSVSLSSSSVSSSISSSSVSSSTTSASSSITKSDLSASEAKIKIESIDGNSYGIEVIDTGYQNGNLWKVGKKFKINLIDFTASVGNTYKVKGISESGNTSSFDLITADN